MATRQGSVERGVLADLRSIPAYLREGGQARAALTLARLIDSASADPKDRVAATRELRQLLTGLLDKAPREGAADGVDEIAAQREKRQAGAADAGP
jgi:hypothetical protein